MLSQKTTQIQQLEAQLKEREQEVERLKADFNALNQSISLKNAKQTELNENIRLMKESMTAMVRKVAQHERQERNTLVHQNALRLGSIIWFPFLLL